MHRVKFLLIVDYSLFELLQGKNFGERAMLLYDGLHYDALAVCFSLSTSFLNISMCL